MAFVCGIGPVVHVELFQDKVKFEQDGKNEQSRAYDISKLPIRTIFPDSDVDYDPDNTKPDQASTLRIFRYFVAKEARVIEIRYKPNHLYVFADGKQIAAKAHARTSIMSCHSLSPPDDIITIPFNIPEYLDEVDQKPGKERVGNMLTGEARARWCSGRWAFKVTITVRDSQIPIPCVWSCSAGQASSAYIPDIMTPKNNLYDLEQIKKGEYNIEWSCENKIDPTKTERIITGVDELLSCRIWYFVVEKEAANDQEKVRAVEVARKKANTNELIVLVDGMKVGQLDANGKAEFKVLLEKESGKQACGHIVKFSSGSSSYQLAIGETYIPMSYTGDAIVSPSFYSPVLPKIKVDASSEGWPMNDGKWARLQNGAMEPPKSDPAIRPGDVARIFHCTAKFGLHTILVLHRGGDWTFFADGNFVEKIKDENKRDIPGGQLSSKGQTCGCCCNNAEEVIAYFSPPDDNLGLEFKVKFTWKGGKVNKWSYLLEASGPWSRDPVLVRPMFGKGGVGAAVAVYIAVADAAVIISLPFSR
jgi:hypothetical protein